MKDNVLTNPIMNALIIADGLNPPGNILRSLCRHKDLIVCADGGANQARKSGVHPDIILGDLDSVSSPTLRKFRKIPLMFVDDKNTTDLEKAILYCLSRGARSITITGGLGTRIDHATGSLGCLRKYSDRCAMTLYDSLGFLLPVKTSLRIQTRVGERISLIPLTRCTGITTKNLKFPLKKESLELGKREGISNEATSSSVSVRLKRGTLLLYRFQE